MCSLRSLPFRLTRMSPWMRPKWLHQEPGRTTPCMEWPLRRGIRTRQICVCRTGRATHDNMSCTSRRNDLGAIAMKRTIATSRSNDDPTNPIKKTDHNHTPKIHRFKRGRQRSPLPLHADPDAKSFRLTDSYRNGDIDRGDLMLDAFLASPDYS